MKIFFISDIHGNQFALKAILEEAKRLNVDIIYCLGDISGYFTGTNEVIELLKTHKVISIKGNHDAFLSGELEIREEKGYYKAYQYTKTHLLKSEKQWLTSLPNSLAVDELRLYHGGPNDHLCEYVFPNKISVDDFEPSDGKVNVFGHTHLQFVVEQAGKRFANPGSVGLARNGDFRAHGLAYDTETNVFSDYRIPYPVNEAITLFTKNESVNPKYLHNLNFGRSSMKKLADHVDYFLTEDSILNLNDKEISVINTKFGAVLSKREDAFLANVIYLACYDDKSVELTSNTLLFNWQKEKLSSNNDQLPQFLSTDNAGVFYLENFTSVEVLNKNLVDSIVNAFQKIELFKTNNVRI